MSDDEVFPVNKPDPIKIPLALFGSCAGIIIVGLIAPHIGLYDPTSLDKIFISLAVVFVCLVLVRVIGTWTLTSGEL